MTVIVEDLRILLQGNCGVEDAETLLAALLDDPSRMVTIQTGKLHTALWQVLMATRPRIEADTQDAFVSSYLLPLVLDADAGPGTLENPQQHTTRSGQ
jgi:hypothetical protein